MRIVTAILLIAVLLGVYALMEDAFIGFHFSKSAKTWSGWALGLVLLGVIYVITEGGFEWATADDRTTDPLSTRLGRLLLGIAICAAALFLAAFVYRLFT